MMYRILKFNLEKNICLFNEHLVLHAFLDIDTLEGLIPLYYLGISWKSYPTFCKNIQMSSSIIFPLYFLQSSKQYSYITMLGSICHFDLHLKTHVLLYIIARWTINTKLKGVQQCWYNVRNIYKRILMVIVVKHKGSFKWRLLS